VLLPEAVWKVLFPIYGGIEICRKSIEAACDEDTKDKSYIVEVYYQKLLFYILPKATNHLVLKKPSGVFISRKATVFDFHKKIAEIFYANTKTRTVEELMAMSRIWRLDTGETVNELEKDY